jgi:hypothetical protein
MWDLRESFPLHFTVFKQTACHLAHEANVEKVFSKAGLITDPKLLLAHLLTLVMVGFNKKDVTKRNRNRPFVRRNLVWNTRHHETRTN